MYNCFPLRIAREQRRRFHEVNKRSRSPTLLFVRAINQSPQLAQIYQYLRHQPGDTGGADVDRRREGMKSFKELPSWFEIRVTWSKLSNWRVHSNRDDVGHRCFPRVVAFSPSFLVSGASAGFCIYLDPCGAAAGAGATGGCPGLTGTRPLGPRQAAHRI